MAPKYKIITNPGNLFLRQEVWYSGDAEVQDERGFVVRKDVTRVVRRFRTEEAANEYIRYQQEVRAFMQGTPQLQN